MIGRKLVYIAFLSVTSGARIVKRVGTDNNSPQEEPPTTTAVPTTQVFCKDKLNKKDCEDLDPCCGWTYNSMWDLRWYVWGDGVFCKSFYPYRRPKPEPKP